MPRGNCSLRGAADQLTDASPERVFLGAYRAAFLEQLDIAPQSLDCLIAIFLRAARLFMAMAEKAPWESAARANRPARFSAA